MVNWARGFGFLWLLSVLDSVIGEAIVDRTTLRFVHVIWRHGDRTPSKGTFPTDTKNGASTWPQEWGELTSVGMNQHFTLGSQLRRRYVLNGFLSQEYKANEVYIRSTDYNRTIMSALSNMAGMYPPAEDQIWNKNFTWQPVPIHVVDKENDPLLYTDMPCPTYNQTYYGEILKSAAIRKIEDDHKELFKFLREKTGSALPGLDDVWSVFDPLNCERIHNHEWPTWVNQSLFDKVKQLNHMSSAFYFHDPRLQKVRGAQLFGEIASRMDEKAKNASTLRPVGLKYYVYSAHDTTMMALMENMGVFNGWSPEYAAAIMFELHEVPSGSGAYVVSVWYINETGRETPNRVVITGCGATVNSPDCKLDAFVTMAASRVPEDWYAECGFETDPDAKKIRRLTVAAVILGIIAGGLLIVVAVLLRKLSRGKDFSWKRFFN